MKEADFEVSHGLLRLQNGKSPINIDLTQQAYSNVQLLLKLF